MATIKSARNKARKKTQKIRAKLRNAQNAKDYQSFLACRGFNGCSTLAVVESKMRGANHKKLYVESTGKQHFKPFSNK
jgi:hypothetical protein